MNPELQIAVDLPDMPGDYKPKWTALFASLPPDTVTPQQLVEMVASDQEGFLIAHPLYPVYSTAQLLYKLGSRDFMPPKYLHKTDQYIVRAEAQTLSKSIAGFQKVTKQATEPLFLRKAQTAIPALTERHRLLTEVLFPEYFPPPDNQEPVSS